MNNENENIMYNKPVIKVMGLGGGGGNAIDRMLTLGYRVDGVEFISANTDLQALKRCHADTKLLIGPNITNGLGSGGNPEVGERAAYESEALIREALTGADIVFLTAGMGGGTGSGAISVAARIARELGAITISVVSTPFSVEGGKRTANARASMMKLARYSDTLITIPNDQLLKVYPKNVSLKQAFAHADDVLRQGIVGITRLLTDTGEINVDFAHIRSMMQNGGGSLLSIGYGKGPDKVSNALYQALNHPLLEHLPIENATGIIANFAGDENLSFNEVTEGLSHLQQLANYRADIIPGQIVDNKMHDEVQIILIITGIASTPIESVKEPEVVDEEPVRYIRTRVDHFVVPEDVIEDEEEIEDTTDAEPEPVMAVHESTASASVSAPVSAAAERIYPTAELPSDELEMTPAAAAAFDTFMSPLGLSGIEPLTSGVPERQEGSEADLDIPTFIRRRM